MFDPWLKNEIKRKYTDCRGLRDKDDEVVPNCYFVTNPVEEYCVIALYSYGRLVAVEDCASQELTLYCDRDGYEWSRSTMRHIVIWCRDYLRKRGPRGNIVHDIAGVRRAAARKIKATDGCRVVGGEMVRP